MGGIRTEAFIRSLEGVDNKMKVYWICRKEMDYLRTFRTTDGSLKTALSEYKQALRAVDEHHPAIKYLHRSKEVAAQYRDSQNEKLSIRQHNVRTVSDPDAFKIKCEWLLREVSYIDHLLGLAGLTGRRTSELMCTAKMTPVDYGHVMFEGQLKTRKGEPRPPYIIPVLTDSTVVVEALEKLQAGKPELWGNPKKTVDRTSKAISAKVNKHFIDLLTIPVELPGIKGKRLEGRDLRRAYAAIAFHESDKGGTITKQRYISDILGHGENDMGTGASYMDFIIGE